MSGNLLVAAPKLLQAVIAALMDYFTWGLSRKIYGKGGNATLALTALSPWQWFCSTRTLSNSLEATLTIAALYFWPYAISSTQAPAKKEDSGVALALPRPRDRLRLSLTLAAIATILRPTNLLIWIIVAGLTVVFAAMTKPSNFSSTTLRLISGAAFCGVLVTTISVLADRIYFQTWTFPPARFIHFNIVQSLAVFYGQNRPDYYITEGLPLLLTTAMPFALVGWWRAQAVSKVFSTVSEQTLRSTKALFSLAVTVTAMITVLSLISHKEVRFIYPLLPLLHVLAVEPLRQFFSPFPSPRSGLKRLLLGTILAFNISFAMYVGMIHQRGVVEVTHFLRHEYEQRYLGHHASAAHRPAATNMTVAFLMPCHSTPWRSHLVHSGIDAWALTCEPPIGVPLSERSTYLDEADQFYASPESWLTANMADVKTITTKTDGSRDYDANRSTKRGWPRYLAFFEQLEPTMNQVLQETRYSECWRSFNTHWHDDWRRKGDVLVWCLDQSADERRKATTNKEVTAYGLLAVVLIGLQAVIFVMMLC